MTEQSAASKKLRLVASNVLPLRRPVRSADTCAALERLLDQARAGEIRGFLWVAQYGDKEHRPGATGEYTHDLTKAIGAAVRLMDALHLPSPENTTD